MIATRYAGAVALLVGLALVPTVVHGYLGARSDDGMSAGQAIGSIIGAPGVDARARSLDWAEKRFATRDWAERTYDTPEGRVRLSVARTFDPKRVYHHPELAIVHGGGFTRATVVRFASLPDVPVHVLRGSAERDATMALYALHYDDDFVGNPLLFQFKVAPELLVSGRKPMTLFFVTAPDAGAESIDGTWAARVLESAVTRFLSAPARTEVGQPHPGR